MFEAHQVLEKVRQESNFKPVYLRKLAYALGLREIPKLRVLVRQWLGYEGYRVTKENLASVDSRWKASSYKFM